MAFADLDGLPLGTMQRSILPHAAGAPLRNPHAHGPASIDNQPAFCNDSALCGRAGSSLRCRAAQSSCEAETMWHDLWVALALLLVIEGVMPFLAPNTMRRMLLEVARQDSRSLRLAGLASMLGGVGLLYLIN
jgi:uncharacterized protein YjeT (DUF2065 family)